MSPTLVHTLMSFSLQPYDTVTGLARPVTLASVAGFLGALAWAWLLLVSFTGWGKLTGRLLRLEPLPASVTCALGIASIVFLGGWLNLLHAIYPAVLIVLATLGLVFYGLMLRRRNPSYKWRSFWSQTSTSSKVLLVVTMLILLLRVAATVRLGVFRIDDDGSGYLVFPQKMLAAHHFAADPFSDRRVISSLGGSYLLQAFILAATSLSHIGMADRTWGLILIFFALLDLGIAFGLAPFQIAIMELIAYLVPQETFNLTYTVLPIALFLSMFWLVAATSEVADTERKRYTLALGAIGGAILCLKSTFLPYIGAVTLFPYIAMFYRKERFKAVRLPILAGFATVATVFAWMLAMKTYSGTYLFPILGHGFDYSNYGVLASLPRFSSSKAIAKIFLQGIFLLGLACIQIYSGLRSVRSRLSLGVLLAAAFAITAFNYESGADFIYRYNFPQFFTAILVFFAVQAGAMYCARMTRKTVLTYAVALFSLASCLLYYDLEGGRFSPFREMRTEAAQYREALEASLSGRHLINQKTKAEYRAVEAAVPAGATALDLTQDSFLFSDNDRRRFLLDDWPGAAGPAPGWPLNADPSAVAKYLADHSVDYVVYGYDYADWTDMKACQFFPSAGHFSNLDKALEILTLLTLHQMDQLRTAYKTVYDDGKIAVIDLRSPVLPRPPVPASWNLDTSLNEMCTTVAQKYIARHPEGSAAQQPAGS